MFKIWRSHRVVSVNFHNFDQNIVKMLKRNFPKVGTVSEAVFSTNAKKHEQQISNCGKRELISFLMRACGLIDTRKTLQLFIRQVFFFFNRIPIFSSCILSASSNFCYFSFFFQILSGIRLSPRPTTSIFVSFFSLKPLWPRVIPRLHLCIKIQHLLQATRKQWPVE